MTNSELKAEALRSANTAIASSRSFTSMTSLSGVSSNPRDALNLAKEIYAWFVAPEDTPVVAVPVDASGQGIKVPDFAPHSSRV